MSNYILAYYMTTPPSSPEAGAEGRKAFDVWLENLGDAVVNPGTPLGPSKDVTPGGVSDSAPSRMIGFSVIAADTPEAALEIAKACPFLEMGTIQLAPMMEM